MVLLMVVWCCCCCHYWRANSMTSVLIEFWGRENVLAAFPNFWCCSERWYGPNRMNHPDWVKICDDPNGQIKLRAKQKYEVLSATYSLVQSYVLFFLWYLGRPARTYIQQLCEDTGCNPEDLPEARNDREKWRESVRDIRASDTTWWWWWWWW